MADGREAAQSRTYARERRIGSRQPLGHAVSFQPSTIRKRRRKSQKARPAVIVDFSLTGLLLRSATDGDIEVGSQAAIEADGLHAVVQVERIDKTDDPETSLYGVQFLSIDPHFRNLIHEAVASPGANATDWR